MPRPEEDLERWFAERPVWMRQAATLLLERGGIDRADLGKLIATCKSEVGIGNTDELPANPTTPINISGREPGARSIHLMSIFDVNGINALAPRNPLEFGEVPLMAVYGLNASGKSGYIRVLKHASGQRRPGLLYDDVFSIGPSDQSCMIRYKIAGIMCEVRWTLSGGPVENLRGVQVFDSSSGSVYVNEENEAAYEPPLLSLFTQLTHVCGQVSSAIEMEIASLPSRRPILPSTLQGTDAESWYHRLSYLTRADEVNQRCQWTGPLESELQELTERLAEPNPRTKADELRNQRDRIATLELELRRFGECFADGNCAAYLAAAADAAAKRAAAEATATVVFSNAPLDGVGSDVWKVLWRAARNYSDQIAYRNTAFPNTAPDAFCVLCQQDLSSDARLRLSSFESFVTSDLERQAARAVDHMTQLHAQFSALDESQFVLRLDSTGLSEQSRNAAISYFQSLEIRRMALQDVKDPSRLPALPSLELLASLSQASAQLDARAALLDQDAGGQNRPKMERRQRELTAQKWLSQQKKGIEIELDRLQLIHRLEAAQRLANTQQLSVKKSALADELITGAFIRRFQAELEKLGGSRIKVALVKTRTERGHVYHEVRLQGLAKDVRTADVLSEGEFRLVSLAAFLADTEGRGQGFPFVFDDPISSLDQVFEQATAERLVELSRSRQVVVFTHRLSLLEHLERAAEACGCKLGVAYVRREAWGAGEPGAPRLSELKPPTALEELSRRTRDARTHMERHGQASYEHLARGICGDFRSTIERVIEKVLLFDIVKRYSRELQTKGKLEKLSKITAEDCELLDGLMSAYSTYEHSQPEEAPVEIPQPDKIGADINRLREWISAYKKRVG